MFTSFFSKSQIKKTIILSAIGIVAIILYVVLDLIFKWNQELALFGYIFCLIYLIIGWMEQIISVMIGIEKIKIIRIYQ